MRTYVGTLAACGAGVLVLYKAIQVAPVITVLMVFVGTALVVIHENRTKR